VRREQFPVSVTPSRRVPLAILAALVALVVSPAAQSQGGTRMGHGVPGATSTPAAVTVQVFSNVVYKNTTTYEGNPLQLALDIYVPHGPGMSGPWPAMIMLHGGGWGDGTKADVSDKATDFAALGFVTYAVDFRESCDPLNPASGDNPALCGFMFDTHLQDIHDALVWIRENAPSHPEWETMIGPSPIDGHPIANKVALWGTSSGANLAAGAGDGWAGNTNPDPSVTPGYDKPDAVVDWSGGVDYVDGTEDTSVQSRMPDYVGCHPYQNPTDCPGGSAGATQILSEISPLFNLGADDPPVFIMQADQDPLLPMQFVTPYDDQLKSLGIAQDYYIVHGSCHGLKCTTVDPNLEANNAAWLHQLLGPKQPTAPVQSGPDSTTPLVQATFTFTPGAGATVQCALDTAPLAPCTSPVTYTDLAAGPHTFTTVATDSTGTGDPSIYPWTIAPRTVAITDSSFNPASLTQVTPGSLVQWTNNGPSSQTVTDSSGMSFFDSGTLGVGGTFTQMFAGAGTYNYKSTPTALTGSVKVPIQLSASSVSAGQPYTVTWAGQAPPSGFAYDAQYQVPGTTQWVSWQTKVTTLSAVVATDSSTTVGKWIYRARLHKLSNNKTSSWSPTNSITVAADTTPPTDTITSGPPNPSTDTTATFTYTASEPSTFTCSLDQASYVSCPSTGITYTGLTKTSHSFGVKATDLAGNVSTPATSSWYVSKRVTATVTDTGFTPVSTTIGMGSTVQWTNTGTVQHTATDKSKIGLFDSGPLSPGGTFQFFFNGASTYFVQSTGDAFSAQTIKIAPVISPTTGTTTTPFKVTWAAMTPPPNLLFDVFVKAPGSSTFFEWKLGATTASDTFVPSVVFPTGGPGTYTFYARLRSIADVTEGNSPQVSITVTS